jgi:hypothetical protein
MNRRRFLKYVAACLIMFALLPTLVRATSATQQPYRQFQMGMTYAVWWHDTYSSADSDRSIEALAQTGANWVALIVTWYQDKYTDSSMKPDADRTPSDVSIVHAMQMIHNLGMRIMLKPHVDLLESEHWRGEIQPANVEGWFDSYRAFITHYAELAQANGVEMLSVGTELNSMTMLGYTAHWLTIIDAVKRVYGGELTYAANWWPNYAWQDVGFLKELDYLGIDAYFPLTEKNDPTVSELENAWKPWVSQIEAWQKLTEKQIIFTEIGYRDIKGANIHPWDWQTEGVEDQQEQADCYQATLAVFWEKPWLQGIFWWAWTYNQPPRDYTPSGKLAEGVLREWYAKPYIPQGTPPEMASALTAIQKAESAIATAMREGRTRGLQQANGLLSQAIAAYDQGEFSQSEALTNSAVKSAYAAVSQEEYEQASTAVNQANRTLGMLRNGTLLSSNAIQLTQQAEAEYTLAVQGLDANQFNLAIAHATNATSLAEKAISAEHDFEVLQSLLNQQQQQHEFLLMFGLAMTTFIILSTIIIVKMRRRR